MFLYMYTVKFLVMMHTILHIPYIFSFLPDDATQSANTRRRQYVT
jgi:predicted metallopeptidase